MDGRRAWRWATKSWWPGEKSFAAKVLEALDGAARAGRRKSSVGGAAAPAHGELEANRLARTGFKVLGLPDEPGELAGRGKWMAEKALLGALIRQRTGVGNGWVASRLAMGHEVMVARTVRRVRENGELGKRLAELEPRVLEERPEA
jgi:hypothetical protein